MPPGRALRACTASLWDLSRRPLKVRWADALNDAEPLAKSEDAVEPARAAFPEAVQVEAGDLGVLRTYNAVTILVMVICLCVQCNKNLEPYFR